MASFLEKWRKKNQSKQVSIEEDPGAKERLERARKINEARSLQAYKEQQEASTILEQATPAPPSKAQELIYKSNEAKRLKKPINVYELSKKVKADYEREREYKAAQKAIKYEEQKKAYEKSSAGVAGKYFAKAFTGIKRFGTPAATQAHYQKVGMLPPPGYSAGGTAKKGRVTLPGFKTGKGRGRPKGTLDPRYAAAGGVYHWRKEQAHRRLLEKIQARQQMMSMPPQMRQQQQSQQFMPQQFVPQAYKKPSMIPHIGLPDINNMLPQPTPQISQEQKQYLKFLAKQEVARRRAVESNEFPDTFGEISLQSSMEAIDDSANLVD